MGLSVLDPGKQWIALDDVESAGIAAPPGCAGETLVGHGAVEADPAAAGVPAHSQGDLLDGAAALAHAPAATTDASVATGQGAPVQPAPQTGQNGLPMSIFLAGMAVAVALVILIAVVAA